MSRLADTYAAAHRDEERKSPRIQCKKFGHRARECRQPAAKPKETKENGDQSKPGKPKCDLKDVECYNCHQKGHYSSNCPSNAMFCRGKSEPFAKESINSEVKRAGAVEGNYVENILLDIPKEKLLEGEVRCAHDDTVLYPLAQVEVSVGGRSLEVKAAISETLPMDVLLGTDVPELGELLGLDVEKSEAMAVTTRAQAREAEQQEEQEAQSDLKSEAKVTGMSEPSITEPEWMDTFDDGLFEGDQEKVKPSRSQKRQHWEPEDEEVEDSPPKITPHALDITAGKMQTLQETDTSLGE